MDAARRHWYRNPGGAYHWARADWIETGRAVCGAAIPRPPYMAWTLADARTTKQRICVHCVRKEGR